MKKGLLIILLFPLFAFAELLSVELICRGDAEIYCEDMMPCGTEPAMEKIKIDGNTLVHKALGNHFLNVNSHTVRMQELDEDGNIGFSLNIDRKTGLIEIIRGWGRPYRFTGQCELDRLGVFTS
ncbi:hypothetical protein OAP73_06370 [Methylophilaceae bacterium]|nr:hypothetical protein [Methylophilaceae bacterium]